ncbi:MAG: hypothetical protein ABS911_09845 [Carnobacterium sp.]|uniref:hypothetical protein n=1 Tax=Carnobacterium sp. TaxID=48221 RepID=UPI0033155040
MWLFTKEEYDNLKREHLKKKNKTPKGFVSVKYDLPFTLPLRDLERSLFRYEEQDIVMMTRFKTRDEKSQKYYPFLPIAYTETEIVICHYEHIEAEKSEKKMHEAVDLTFDFLQHFIDSLIVKLDPPGIQRISRQDLPAAFPVSVIRSTNFKPHSIEISMVVNPHGNHVLKSQKRLTSKQLNSLIGFVNETNKTSSEFVTSILYMRESKSYLTKGHYNSAIIHLQTSIEIFMYTVYRLILINKEKLSEEIIEKKLKTNYNNLLTTNLSNFFSDIGYTFNFDKKDDPSNLLNDYKEKVYMIRNKIAHEGYRCSENEANQAFTVGKEVLQNITDEINQSDLKKYIFQEGINIESRTFLYD